MFSNLDVIHSYTRQQAIADGVLVDLSSAYPRDTRAYRYPVACTASVWSLIEAAVANRDGDHSGLVYDLCWMSQKGIIRRLGESGVLFGVIIGPKERTLKALCGPGDDMEPVVTIMMEDED